ncbi:MAG: peroxiredoxin [Caulobacteraceae bacterium]|nr:peroxiredoxin [Caulobacter sp.]
MTIAVGDRLPAATLMTLNAEGAPEPVDAAQAFAGKTVALFAVPGAYTPTCSAKHVPSFRQRQGELKGQGVDAVALTSTNDIFVLKAWAKDQGVDGDFMLLADGNGDFAKALGLSVDASKHGLGVRSQRYSMLVKDGVVEQLNVEENPGAMEVSDADTLLKQIIG